VAAAGRTRFVTRGPKPVRALKEVGLSSALSAQPATTEGVIATLRGLDLRGQTVGLTLYGVPNPPLVQFLEEAGATVKQVLPYVYAPAADAERVADLIRGLAAGAVDGLLFTSSPQVERLFEVARERDLEGSLREGLARTCVAAVGPVVADKLQELGVRLDVCPEQGFVMKNLVTLLTRHLAGAGK
jgi:uroporphyrinogen-III synthase